MSVILANGNMPLYRFYVYEAPTSLEYEVFPLNFLATSLVDELEQGQAFYRRKFAGKLLFGTNSKVVDEHGVTQNRKDDWTLFWNQENHDPCAKIYLTIHKIVQGVVDADTDPDPYWEGHFSTTDGFFDIDKCTFEVTPLPNDDYTDIFDKADTQYNILNAGAAVPIHAFLAGFIDVNYTRNRWLCRIGSSSVLEYLAKDATVGIVPGAAVVSTFFTAANNPVTKTTNHLLYLTIAQKSDIIRPAATNPATSAMMSWNKLMDILWAMFQVKWKYDPSVGVGGTIYVEHINYFTSTVDGMDLRTQKMCKATNKYSYIKEKMPKYEKFAWMEADNPDFIGLPIEYDSACVDQDPKTNIVETSLNVTTDLEFIYLNSSAVSPPVEGVISDEGFVILCTDDTDVKAEGGFYIGYYKLNMHLSWANLHHRYYRHNRVLINGHINGADMDFWSAQKTKKQNCSAILCGSYDPSDLIKTELGMTHFGGAKAQVQSSALSPSGEIKFSLLYGPVDNAVAIAAGVADYAGGLPDDPVADGYSYESPTSFEAIWTVDSSASGYFLDVSTDIGFPSFVTIYHDLDVGFANGYFVEGLNLVTTIYYFRLRAYGPGGFSGYSSIITVNET